jgi:hypothetical protein
MSSTTPTIAWTNLLGGSTLTLNESHTGKEITVIATHTDGAGNFEHK